MSLAPKYKLQVKQSPADGERQMGILSSFPAFEFTGFICIWLTNTHTAAFAVPGHGQNGDAYAAAAPDRWMGI